MSTEQNGGSQGKRFYRERAQSLVWSQLDQGEPLLETIFAQLDAPGALAVTDRRLLFVGRGLFFRREPRVASIPRSEIDEISVDVGRFDSELNIRTHNGSTFSFFDVDEAEARRLVAVHAQAPIELFDESIVVIGHGPRFKLAPLLIVAAGALAIPWQPVVGVATLVLGVVYVFVRRSRASRINIRSDELHRQPSQLR